MNTLLKISYFKPINGGLGSKYFNNKQQNIKQQYLKRDNSFKCFAKRAKTKDKDDEIISEDDKQKEALWNRTIDEINRKHGANSVETFEDSQDTIKSETQRTGVTMLDWALGGGYRKGGIVEIFGNEATGKSTLAMQCCAEIHKKGGRVLYVDAEFAFNDKLAEGMGIEYMNKKKFAYHAPEYGEKALEIVEKFCKSGAVDLVVVDSVAALLPKADAVGDMGQVTVGTQARLMSSCLKRVVSACNESKCIVIFINQVRNKIGVLYGNPETTPGGKALLFYASQRIRISRVGSPITRGKKDIGVRVKCKVVKNKIANPNQEAEFNILWGKGVDNKDQLIDLLEVFKIMERRGAYYYEKGSDKAFARGRDAAVARFAEDSQLYEKYNNIVQQCIANMGPDDPTLKQDEISEEDGDDEFNDYDSLDEEEIEQNEDELALV